MDSNTTTANKKLLFIIGAVVFIIASILLVIQLSLTSTNPNGDQLEISNLNEYTNGKPSNRDRLDFIKHNLLEVVNLNVDTPVENESIKDVVVRKGSFTQKFDNEKDLHSVKFIVDIKSLKQSYNVSYQWVEGNEFSSEVDEYGTLVTCLPVSQLKYGDFNCVDSLTLESGEKDPVLERLENAPVNNIYEIYGQVEEDGTKKIIIRILANNYTERTRLQYENYKQQALGWLASENIDTTKYKIEWRNLENEVVPDSFVPPDDA